MISGVLGLAFVDPTIQQSVALAHDTSERTPTPEGSATVDQVTPATPKRLAEEA
jgi:hypothetical protein